MPPDSACVRHKASPVADYIIPCASVLAGSTYSRQREGVFPVADELVAPARSCSQIVRISLAGIIPATDDLVVCALVLAESTYFYHEAVSF
jgi:hypothetical protein